MSQRAQRDFDQHWRGNLSSQVSNCKLREVESFFRPVCDMLCAQPTELLDVGCGDGVHWRYLHGLGNEQLDYTGIDISTVAVQRVHQFSSGGRARFIQMDGTALALPSGGYDLVFAFGVVAYTSDPQRCFWELCRVCKPGGWIGVWIYPKQEGLAWLAFRLVRQICQRVGSFWTRRVADLIVPFLGALPTRSKMSLRNSTWRQCREVVLVNVAPEQLAFFGREEIAAWFMVQGVDIQYEDEDNPITIWGRKR